MSDYINKDAFVKNITERYCSGCNDHFGVKCKACWVDDMLGEIDDAPTEDAVIIHTPTVDAEPVVRCKDCLHSSMYEPVVRCMDCLHSSMYCFGNSKTPTLACVDYDEDGSVGFATAVRENFFCADGKRKGEVSE